VAYRDASGESPTISRELVTGNRSEYLSGSSLTIEQ
jgi:hypothetical protein